MILGKLSNFYDHLTQQSIILHYNIIIITRQLIMMPSFSNHLNEFRKTNWVCQQEKQSGKKSKYYFEQIMRKHSKQERQKKIIKSYSNKKQTHDFQVVIPSFLAYESKNHIKINIDNALGQAKREKLADSPFSSSKNGFRNNPISQTHTTKHKRIQNSRNHSSQGYRNTKNQDKKISSFFNHKQVDLLSEKNEEPFPYFQSQILPVTFNTKRRSFAEGTSYQSFIKPKKKSVKISYNKPIIKTSRNETPNKLNTNNFELILYQKCGFSFSTFMEMYAKRQQIEEGSHLFIYDSSDYWIKEALLRRGWIQNPYLQSYAFHLKWSTKISKKKKFKEQILNHFQMSDMITSKGQLAMKIRKSQELRKIVPRTFDLGSELQLFLKHFTQTAILCGLKKLQSTINPQQKIKNLEVSQMVDILKEIQNNPLQIGESSQKTEQIIHIPYSIQICAFCLQIACLMQNIVFIESLKLNPKSVQKLTDFSELNPPYCRYKHRRVESNNKLNQLEHIKFNKEDINQYSARTSFGLPSQKLKSVIISLHHYFWNKLNTYSVEGQQNIWIIKARNCSKGVGISLSNKQYEICTKTDNRLVQKYIQNCLLYIQPKTNKPYKFDIRVWVLVTSFSPLIAYFYPSFYGRLCSEPYDVNQLQKLTKHLTNYQVNRQNFNTQIQSIITTQQIYESIYRKIYQQQDLNCKQKAQKMQQIQSELLRNLSSLIFETLTQYQSVIQATSHEDNNFQLYGFDILISERITLHLLEVNLSPACDAKRNKWLSDIVDKMADSLLDITLNTISKSQRKTEYKNQWRQVNKL